MYSKSIVTFLDILGFSDLVQNRPSLEVKEAIDAVQRFAVPSEKDRDLIETGYEPQTVQFSDSVVRVRRLDAHHNTEHPIGLLFHELLSLVHAQGELANFGILVRGGVTVGDIFIDEGNVFGPGLIAAYALESKYAIYPRIIIDPELLKESQTNPLLKSQHHSTEDEMEYIRRLVAVGDDGVAYIDYALAMAGEVDEPDMYVEFLEGHKSLILKGGGKYKGIGNVSAKYMWLANYHNRVVRSLEKSVLKQYKENPEDLLVGVDDLPSLSANAL